MSSFITQAAGAASGYVVARYAPRIAHFVDHEADMADAYIASKVPMVENFATNTAPKAVGSFLNSAAGAVTAGATAASSAFVQ